MSLKMGIYKITNTSTGKVYVGSALNIERRLDKHMKELKAGTHHSSKLQRSYAKWGAVAFAHEVLEVVALPVDLLVREQYWIDALNACRNGYNMRPRADNNLGVKASAETRARQSAALKGVKRSPEYIAALRSRMKGKPFPREALEKAAEANGRRIYTPEMRAALAERARNISPEGRAKRSASLKGIKRTAEFCERLSRIHKERGVKPSAEHMEKLRLIHLGCKRSDAFKKNLSEKLKGRTTSEETRQKLSAARTGKARTAESRAKQSASLKASMTDERRALYAARSTGRKHSDETKAKIAESNRRRVYSEETLRKMSESQKGRKQSPEVVARRTATRLANIAATKAARILPLGQNYSLDL